MAKHSFFAILDPFRSKTKTHIADSIADNKQANHQLLKSSAPLLLGSHSASSNDASLTSGGSAEQGVAATAHTATTILLLAHNGRLGVAEHGGTTRERIASSIHIWKQPGHFTSMK